MLGFNYHSVIIINSQSFRLDFLLWLDCFLTDVLITFSEITESLGLEKPELEKTLTTLVDSKLIKLESGKVHADLHCMQSKGHE